MASPEGPLEISEEMLGKAKALADAVPADVTYGVGFKETGGQATDQVALTLFLPEKKPESELAPEEVIPKEFEGHPVDVVEWNPVKIFDDRMYPQLHGGIEIAPDPIPRPDGFANQDVGTLGAIVRRRSDGRQMLLTNSHVVRQGEAGPLVGDMHQPGGGQVVATTARGLIERNDSGLDCAALLPTARNRPLVPTVEGVGPVRGWRDYRPAAQSSRGGALTLSATEAQVKKRGRTTELTHGTIRWFHVADAAAGTTNMVIAPTQPGTFFADHGDSGSVILTETGDEVVGLLHAMNEVRTGGRVTETHGVATLIGDVLDALQVDIVVGGGGRTSGSRPAGGYPRLQQGSRGDAVRTLQEGLVAAGVLNGNADGVFGRGTAAAVRQFQSQHSPPADGVVGRGTWAKLVELGYVPPPPG